MMSDDAVTRAAYIAAFSDFRLVERGEPYGHMCATITDAILQAVMRYHAQVWPRVQRLLTEHPETRTTSDLHQLLAERTPEVVVGIDGRKAAWVRQLTDFLIAKEIETEDHLRAWLATPDHEQQLFALKVSGSRRSTT